MNRKIINGVYGFLVGIGIAGILMSLLVAEGSITEAGIGSCLLVTGLAGLYFTNRKKQ